MQILKIIDLDSEKEKSINEIMKIETIAEKAQIVFWEVVSENYPEIKTGDFCPIENYKFEEACLRAIEHWVEQNQQNKA